MVAFELRKTVNQRPQTCRLLPSRKSSPERGGAPTGRRGPTLRFALLVRCGTPPTLRATSPFRGGFERSALDARAQLNKRLELGRLRTERPTWVGTSTVDRRAELIQILWRFGNVTFEKPASGAAPSFYVELSFLILSQAPPFADAGFAFLPTCRVDLPMAMIDHNTHSHRATALPASLAHLLPLLLNGV
jgi:hypothetical protein